MLFKIKTVLAQLDLVPVLSEAATDACPASVAASDKTGTVSK